jgi:hypothetical protein
MQQLRAQWTEKREYIDRLMLFVDPDNRYAALLARLQINVPIAEFPCFEH